LSRKDKSMPAKWIHVEDTGETGLAALRGFGIPESLLDHVRDLGERPRLRHQGEVVLLVVSYPHRQAGGDPVAYVTSPLSLFVVDGTVITLAPRPLPLLADLRREAVAEPPRNPTHFVLRLLERIAEAFLDGVREIDTAAERLEDRLGRSLRNQEVLGLLGYQKSLTHFATAMRANEIVLDRLRKLPAFEWSAAEHDLLEDVLVEVRQAIEMVEISDNILAQMMDAFASIVSNNLNSVMKMLTSVTIIIALPTLVASLYGMNVGLPGARSPLAFAGIVLLCVLLGAGLVVIFKRRNWL
jgi:magnesium transporter